MKKEVLLDLAEVIDTVAVNHGLDPIWPNRNKTGTHSAIAGMVSWS